MMFENATLTKLLHFLMFEIGIKDALLWVTGACATKYHYIEQSCALFMHLIHIYDFVVIYIDNAIVGVEKQHANETLASYLIRDDGIN